MNTSIKKSALLKDSLSPSSILPKDSQNLDDAIIDQKKEII
jgi:hypothetical protein